MTVTLMPDKPAYNSGDTITLTYSGVVLNPGTPDVSFVGSGEVTIDAGPPIPSNSVTVTVKGKPADVAVYGAPIFPGLTFTQSSTNPAVWTAKAP